MLVNFQSAHHKQVNEALALYIAQERLRQLKEALAEVQRQHRDAFDLALAPSVTPSYLFGVMRVHAGKGLSLESEITEYFWCLTRWQLQWKSCA